MTAEPLDDLIARLRATFSPLQKTAPFSFNMVETMRLCGEAADAIVALRARAQEAERDAQRYRWLRHDYVSPRRSQFAVVVNNAHPSGLKRYWDMSLDAALDAEMRAEQIEKDNGG